MSTLLFSGGLSYCLAWVLVFSIPIWGAQSPDLQLQAEHNPSKRSALALHLASAALDDASDFYKAGDIHQGDAELEEMTNDLKECLRSLEEAHKSGSYKKAELKVAYLQRRLHDLVSDLNIADRGWAEQTERTVEGIHDQILNRVMKK